MFGADPVGIQLFLEHTRSPHGVRETRQRTICLKGQRPVERGRTGSTRGFVIGRVMKKGVMFSGRDVGVDVVLRVVYARVAVTVNVGMR